ncbi:MAG: hypothetical protein ACHQ53_11310 [Polyangiales bacterium]
MKAPRSPHDAIVVPTSGPLYGGKAGQTRKERLHLVEPDGTVRSVELYRVVNVASHPDLKPRVLAGQLHRLEDGRELALPFVYHDPTARKFALVIPPSLAHLEMKEWARLMTEVAEDTSASVPAYVRDGTTVLGLGALELFLETGVEPEDTELSVVNESRAPMLHRRTREVEHELAERARLLDAREREATEQEQSLVRMAGDLSAREASLQRREQQLDATRTELEARQQEQAARSVSSKPGSHTADVVPEGEWQEVRADDAPTVASEQATVVANLADIKSQAFQVYDSELQDLGEALRQAQSRPPGDRASVAPETASTPPPLRRKTRTPPPLRALAAPLAPAMRSPAPPPLPRVAGEPLTDGAPWREASEVPPPLPRSNDGSSPRPRVRPRSVPPPAIEVSPTHPPPPAQPEPPAGFAALPVMRMACKLDERELWLFVKLDARRAQVFADAPELLVQLTHVQQHPVVVLALCGHGGEVARAVLDGLSTEAQAVLERLERSFRAQLVLHVDGTPREQRTLAAPRESNAHAILERVRGADVKGGPSGHDAVQHAIHEPPPVRDEELPFGPPRPQAASTSSVLGAVQRLETWAKPEMLSLALLVYSVPKHVIEASCRRVLRAAIGFGIALPPELRAMALEHKLAGGARELVGEQLAAFRQRIERGHNDLDAPSTNRNWELLFAQAGEVDLAVEPELRTFVERSVAASGAPPPDLPSSSAELRRDLGDPGRRLIAIRALCRRGHASAIEPIFHVLEELSPEEVAAAVAGLLSFGELAADGLVAALGSPSQHVRHASALGLGSLKLRRSMAALIRQLDQETTPSWTEMARALGDFGPPALRNVSRALKTSDHRERLMVSLAHLANHGCAEDVKSLESDPDSTIALAARQAMTRRGRMEWDDQAVRNQQPLRDQSPEARFSQVFYAEVARTTA